MKKRNWIAVGVVSVVGWGLPAWAHPDDDDAGASFNDHNRRTLFVDDDRQQCRNAQFTSIQAAVLAAPPGGHIHVCPGLYPETVTVDHSLRIHGAGPSPAKRTGDPGREAVIQTPDRGFNITGSNVDVSGFTVLGNGATTIGIDVQPFGTGNSVRRNYVSGHVLGIELSVGGPNRQPSLISQNRVENCAFGMSIDDNLGPSPDVDDAKLTVRQNTLSQNTTGMQLLRMRGVQVRQNEITDFSAGIRVIEATEVEIRQNSLETGGSSDVGISLRNDLANAVVGNEISGRFSGPATAGIFLDGSTGDVVAGNRVNRMLGDGVLLSAANGNTVMLNRSDDNGGDGIALQTSSGNQLFLNRMHDNGVFDASDDNRPANVWVNNRCDTDFPPGTICTGH